MSGRDAKWLELSKTASSPRLPVLVVILGLLVTFSTFVLVRDWDKKTAQLRFDALANTSHEVFSGQLQGYFLSLESLRQYFAYSSSVSGEEFSGFTQPYFARFPAIEAIFWVPQVAAEERQDFETGNWQDGVQGRVIHDHAPWEAHRDIPLGQREVYFPIAYIEPREKEGYSQGYDLGLSSELSSLLAQAETSREAKFGIRHVLLADDSHDLHGFIVQKIAATSAPAGARRGTSGFVVMRVDFSAAMQAATRQLQTPDIVFSLYDDSQPAGKQLMFSTADSHAVTERGKKPWSLQALDRTRALVKSRSVTLLGSQWRLQFSPTAAYVRHNYSWHPWIILLLGLVVTLWLVVLIGIWRRRTELMQQAMDEGSLALEKTRLREGTILDTVADGIVTIDSAGLIISFNRAAEEIFGYRAEEVLGRNVSLLLPANERKEHELYTKNTQLFEPRVINRARDLEGCRKDGSLFPLELNIAPYITAEGRGFVGVLRDITARKRTEEKLLEQKERLSDILENTDDGYLQVDWMWRITYINPRAVELLRVTAEEVLMNDLREVMPDVVSIFYKILRSTLVERKHQQATALYGPTMNYLEANAAPTRDGLVVYFRDVTRQKHDELELIKAKEFAEKASQAKSQYLARMSHELRTPMNAVLGFGQLLEMDDSMNPTQRSNVNEIMKAGIHLLALIDEVLDLSRIEAGKFDFKFSEVKLKDIVEESLALVSDMARKRAITLRNRLDAQCDITLCLDPKAIKQILINLLSNAVKYNVDGGNVTLFCETLDDDKVRVCVSDTGPGIAEEFHQRLFDPFERLGREGEVEGTGVGLSVVKALVDGMGGNIGVISEPGKGSTFWVEFRQVTDA